MDKRFTELTDMGLSAEQAQAWIASQEPEEPDTIDLSLPTPVWPENWPSLGLFLRLQTQWVRNARTGRLEGLRHEAADAAMNMMGLADKATMYDHLVEMEHAALEALNDD